MTQKKKKQKKEKIRYIDDGRSLADLSALPDKMSWTKRGTVSPVKEIWKTYWNAVRMMFLPMMVVIAFLAVLYLILTIIFWLM